MIHSQRAKNLIIFKLEDSEKFNGYLFGEILQLFSGVGLAIPEIAIVDVFRLGKIKGNRPVIVKFLTVRWVKLIFSKIIEFKRRNLVISNDYSPEERPQRPLLISRVRELRSAGIVAKIVNNKVITLNDQFY